MAYFRACGAATAVIAIHFAALPGDSFVDAGLAIFLAVCASLLWNLEPRR